MVILKFDGGVDTMNEVEAGAQKDLLLLQEIRRSRWRRDEFFITTDLIGLNVGHRRGRDTWNFDGCHWNPEPNDVLR